MTSHAYNNQAKMSSCADNEITRSGTQSDLQENSQLLDSGNQNVSNLLLSASQGSATNPLLSYQNSSFGSLYGSPGFSSSLAGFENNIQWFTDNRITNQHNQMPGSFITDKNPNTATHTLPPVTSHSCCVNRFGVLDSLGMGSPLPNEQTKSSCDVTSYQGKNNIAVNMIDPMQSWLNFPLPNQVQVSNNQQYCKYGDRPIAQNYNIPVSLPSQMNLPLIDQSDFKQNDICIQSPDTCFENLNVDNNKHVSNSTSISNVKQHSLSVGKQQGMPQENASLLKQQTSFQSNFLSKEWKSFQSMQNYISSPNMFPSVNDPQENFLLQQYNMPPSKIYYPTSETFPHIANKNSCMAQTRSLQSQIENVPLQVSCFPEQNNKYSKYPAPQINSQYGSKHAKENTKTQIVSNQDAGNTTTSVSHRPLEPMSDCCRAKSSQGTTHCHIENSKFSQNKPENKSIVSKVPCQPETDSQSGKRNFRISEAESSESDESNIIVEESDDLCEIESEISIEDIKKTYQETEKSQSKVILRCLICNAASSSHTPADQFVHMNESFPVTSSSRTPISIKLENIVQTDLQGYLKLHNSFLCRRCLNLVETVEVLEIKLKTAKQTISEYFLKTVQQLSPRVEEILQDQVQIAIEVEHFLKDSKKLEKSETKVISDTTKNVKSNEDSEKQDMEEECVDDKIVNVSDNEETVEFQCVYCSKILSSQKTYNDHIQQHTKEFSFYCKSCGKGFALKSTLEKHLNWHNGISKEENILCEICGEVYISKHQFNSHFIKYHSGKFDFECDTCGKGFTRKLSLEIHTNKHFGTRPFICEYCGRTFTSESNLKSHIKLCTRDIKLKCNVCGKSFCTESQLLRHQLLHNEGCKLPCSVCGKGFNQQSDLDYHMLSHSDEKKFKCTHCDKAFKTVGNLNYHLNSVHKEETLFNCPVCGRNFGKKILLEDHMSSHTNEKPYTCKKCNKSFAHQTTFITHLKTHTSDVKIKICQVCGKGIKTRISVHMRTHTGEKPYKCPFCPLAFSVGISLKKHMHTKHGKT